MRVRAARFRKMQGCSLRNIAILVGRDEGKITRFIGRLEAKGLIMRDTLERDPRISVIRPTRQGKQVARALAPFLTTFEKSSS